MLVIRNEFLISPTGKQPSDSAFCKAMERKFLCRWTKLDNAHGTWQTKMKVAFN